MGSHLGAQGTDRARRTSVGAACPRRGRSSPSRSAPPRRDIEKVLRSAVANAEANHGLIGDELVIESAYANEGPTLKRWRPRARGRVNRIFKRTCHITIVLGEDPKADERPKRRRAAAQTETEKTPAKKPKASRKKEGAAA